MYEQVDISTISKAIYIALGIAVLLILSIIFFVVLYRKSHNLFLKEKELMQAQFDQVILQSRIEVQESTFSSLGKELHDNVGQLLSTAKMLLGITERNITNPPDTLHTASETVGKAISEIRSLSKSLSKEWLEQFDLIENLQTEVNRFNSAQELKLSFSHPHKISLQSDKQIILFRIIQEAIQNAIKHASPENILVSISNKGNELVTIIQNDGRRFNRHEITDGMGLANMKQRAALLGGSINWNPSEAGCKVEVKIPLKQDNT